MTATKTIPDLLNLTPEVYEDMRMVKYMRYCMDFSKNYEEDLQKLVSNSALNAWFNMEYAKCENKFLSIVSGYENAIEIMPRDFITIYRQCTLQIYNRRSKPLLEMAKNTNIYSN